MEINVNRLVTDLNPADLSGSIMERGANAGAETWANSLEAAGAGLLADDSERDAARAWAKSFGAWDRAEIAAWSNQELDALVLQYAAGDLRELQGVCPGDGLGGIDWTEAEALEKAGTVGGNLFLHCDTGELYIYIGE